MDSQGNKKPLTARQAWNCENAQEPVCVCRCNGALHGAKRGGGSAAGDMDRAFFEALSEDDPHWLPSDAVKEARKRERLERKRAEKAEAERKKWEYLRETQRETTQLLRDHPEMRDLLGR